MTRRPSNTLGIARLLALVVGAVMAFAGLAPAAAASPAQVTIDVTGERLYSQAYAVVRLINREREALGLKAVTMDRQLLDGAMDRAAEVAVRWGHTRPDGRSWATAMPKSHRTRWWSENIAAGHSDAHGVMAAWLESASHRPHITNAKARSVGVGVLKVGSTRYWVQWFSATTPEEIARPADEPAVAGVSIAGEGYTLSATARPDVALDVGERVRIVTRLAGPESFTRAVLASASLTYGLSGTGGGEISADGVVTGTAPGTVHVSVAVPGDPNLLASVELTVAAGGGSGASRGGDSDGGDDGGGKSALGAGPKPAAPTMKKVTGASRQLRVQWKANGEVSGFRLAYRVKGSGTWKVKTVKPARQALTLAGLRPDTVYQVRVRAYVKGGGQTLRSAWSKTMTTRTKR
jgi:uncharacterized protein YkwD